MIDEKYKIIVDKFFNKTIDDIELEKLKSWLNESVDNRKYFDRSNETYILSGSELSHFHGRVDAGWADMKNEMLSSSKDTKRMPVKSLTIWRMVAVASIILAIGLFGVITFENQKSSIAEVTTLMGQKTNLQLTDGTRVWLNSGSKLKSKESFRNREVFVSGEVYFDVVHDDKPFVVHTGVVSVKVFGTKFNVCAYDNDDEVIVTLEEGKVGMKIQKSKKVYMMNPGENLIYNKKTNKIKRTKVNTNLYTEWKENTLKFSNATFDDVITKIEKWYGVNIHIDKNIKYSERFTMTIHSESLRELLELMTKVAPIKYNIKEDQVFIKHQTNAPMSKN